MKITKRLITVFCFLLLSSYSQAQDSTTVHDNEVSSNTHLAEINQLICYAEQYLGTPYRYAGKDPSGFDCSGFVYYCFGSTLDIQTPASSSDYVDYGKLVSSEAARPGDVICFQGYRNRGNVPGHVGIITEVTPDEIYFIHSASRGGIRYDQLSQKYYHDRFLFIKRVLD